MSDDNAVPPLRNRSNRQHRRSPWTWPLIALVALVLITLGGTIAALLWP